MNDTSSTDSGMPRRDFLKFSAAAGLLAGMGPGVARAAALNEDHAVNRERVFNDHYEGTRLNRVAFPLGGIGGGMICVEGTGALSQISIRNRPDVFNEPCMFAALSVRGPNPVARVLEGQVPGWKLFGMRGCANGLGERSYGLPRFEHAKFEARFPFGSVDLNDPAVPLKVQLTAWSPFTPGDSDSSSLPVAALEYRFTNPTNAPIDAVFSFNAKQFLVPSRDNKIPRAVRALDGGFVLWAAGAEKSPWDETSFAVAMSEPDAKVNHAWFRGGWFDPLTMA